VAVAAAVALATVGATPALAAMPGPPTAVMASAGDAQATVSFTPPGSDGGSPITSYTVTSSPGGITASGASSPIVVSGLTDGVSYTFTVTANNGVTGFVSSPSAAVTPLAPPSASVAPVITGSAEVDQTLSATSGTWSESPQISYQWLDCDPSSSTCSGVAGTPSGAAYTVSSLDAGYSIEVVVTAANVDNEFTSVTIATATVAAQPGAPGVESPPTLSAVDGSAPVSATTGTWSGAPTGYAYQWYACSAALGWCHPVTGLSGLLSSYSPGSDDAGEFLKVGVIATNGVGDSVPAFSGGSGPISFPPPSISLSWPSDGADYSPSLPTAATEALYTCTAGAGETIHSCVGTVAAGSPVPFSFGPHSLTVTATDSDGESVTRTVNYTVGGSPTITLSGPANGGTYAQGSSLPVTVACTAFDGSSIPCTMAQAPQPPCQAQLALVGCNSRSAAPGQPQLDTQDLGLHTFTVSAADAFGETADLSVSYTVVAAQPSVIAAQDARVTIARLGQSSSRWRIGGGTAFSFTPNRAATVTFVFERDLAGRRAGGHCVAQTPANTHEPACTLTKRVGSLTKLEPQGADVVPFGGHLGASTLSPGGYSVVVSAVAIGAKSTLVFTAGTLKFTIVG